MGAVRSWLMGSSLVHSLHCCLDYPYIILEIVQRRHVLLVRLAPASTYSLRFPAFESGPGRLSHVFPTVSLSSMCESKYRVVELCDLVEISLTVLE